MSNYNRSNPFDDDEDIGFGNRGAPIKSAYSKDSSDELARLQAQIGRTENESLESTQRALRALNEAQDTGSKTAAELVRQGEQLRGLEDKLDDIDHTLTTTQKNINKIKSVFGGIKNTFMFRSAAQPQKAELSKTEKKLIKENNARITASQSENNMGRPAAFETITGSDREKEINSNLDEMSKGLRNLNSLALDMKFELERQDPLIQRITDKSEKVHTKIEAQDRDMKRIK